MAKKFVSTMRKGFQMTFANGMTASVQWGAGNYCDNHFPEDMDFSCKRDASSDTAEVAVIYKGELIDFIDEFVPEECSSDGTVAGYLSPEEVLYFLNKVSKCNPAMETDIVCKKCAFIFPVKDGHNANENAIICPNCGHRIEEV